MFKLHLLIVAVFVIKKFSCICEIDFADIKQKFVVGRYCVNVHYLRDSDIDISGLFTNEHFPVVTKIIDLNQLEISNFTKKPRRDFYQTVQEFLCPLQSETYLLVAADIEEFLLFSQNQEETPFLNGQAKYVFIFSGSNCRDDSASKLKNRLRKVFQIPDVTIYGCNCVNPSSSSSYSFNETLRISMFHSILAQADTNSTTSVELQGSDSEFTRVLSEKMKTEIVVGSSGGFGGRQPDGSFDGALGQLLDGEADVCLCSYFVKDYETIDTEFSAVTQDDELCINMKRSGRVPDWQLLYFCFENKVWIAVVLISAFVVIVAKLMKGMDEIFVLFSLIGVPSPKTPKNLFRRIFTATCLIGAVTLSGAFQGSLVTVYYRPLRHPDVDTLEDFAKTGIQIYTRYRGLLYDTFPSHGGELMAKLRKSMQVVNEKQINKVIVERGDVAGLARKKALAVDASENFYDSDGNSMLHIVKECPRSYRLAYVFPKASAFAPVLNNFILRCLQGGFFTKWYADMTFNTTLRIRRKITHLSESNQKIFSLADLQLAFFALFFGCMCSSIVFIFELFGSQLSRWIHKK